MSKSASVKFVKRVCIYFTGPYLTTLTDICLTKKVTMFPVQRRSVRKRTQRYCSCGKTRSTWGFANKDCTRPDY